MFTYHFDYSDEDLAVPHDDKDAVPKCERLKERGTNGRLRKSRLFSAKHYVNSQAINKSSSFAFETSLFALISSFCSVHEDILGSEPKNCSHFQYFKIE